MLFSGYAGKADRSDQLENLLEEVLQNGESLKQIANELGIVGKKKDKA